MKQYKYNLIIGLPPFLVVIVSLFAVYVQFRDLNLIGRWIAKNVFSDILKEESGQDGSPTWFFKDIDPTPPKESTPRKLSSKIRLTSLLLFAWMLTGAILLLW